MDMPAWMPVTLYAIVVLAFIAFYTWNHLDDAAGRKPFVFLAILVAFQLATDFVSRFYIYASVPHWLIVVCTYINFGVLPLIGLSWYRFVTTVLSEGQDGGQRVTDIVVNISAAAGIFVLLLNPFTHNIFTFTDAGVYQRESLYFVPSISAAISMFISEFMLIYRSRMLGRRSLLVLLLFPVAPIIGGVFATQIYGLPWLPLGISLSMVMLFASTFTSGMNTDYLTSVVNRRRIEEILEERVEQARSGKQFAGLMVDVDNFKAINDQLGHAVGDTALAETARLLRGSLRGVDVVGRFGGDEFLAILDVATSDELDAVVSRIRDEEIKLGEGDRQQPYTLRLSKGYAMFDPERFASAQEFEQYLDALMYADKEAHKLQDASTVRL